MPTVLALVALTGCGDSKSDKFASKVNDICRDSQKEIKAQSGKADGLIASGQKFVAKLRAADPPSGKREKYERWVDTQQTFFDELEAAVKAHDQKRVDALDEHAGDKLADELGLDACKG